MDKPPRKKRGEPQRKIKVIDQPPHIIRILCEQEDACKGLVSDPGPAIDDEVTVEPRRKKLRGERTKSGAEILTSQDGCRCEL